MVRAWCILISLDRPRASQLIGWSHFERTQVSELLDGLNFMVVLRHVIGLPQRLWLLHSIVTGRCCRPTLCGVRMILLVGGPGVG